MIACGGPERLLQKVASAMTQVDDPFVRDVGAAVLTIATSHSSYRHACASQHLQTAGPCAEFETAFALAVSWLAPQVPALAVESG